MRDFAVFHLSSTTKLGVDGAGVVALLVVVAPQIGDAERVHFLTPRAVDGGDDLSGGEAEETTDFDVKSGGYGDDDEAGAEEDPTEGGEKTDNAVKFLQLV